MVRIRLRRVGAKKQPSYRIVAADKESPRDGRFLEILGFYNPRTEPATLTVKEDKIYKWLSQGAQPSDSVRQLFQSAGVFERYDRYKAGESLKILMEEAAAAEESRTGSQKTRHPAPSQSVKKEKQPAAEVEPKPEPAAEPEPEPAAEPEPEPAAEPELEPTAEPKSDQQLN